MARRHNQDNFPTRWPRRLAAAILIALAAFQTPLVSAAEELLLCFENENIRPWQTQDGTGLNFELLDLVAGKLGIRFRYYATPWKRCLLDVKNNAVAGALDASFKPERLEVGAYPMLPGGSSGADPARALHIERYVVLKRRGSAVDWDGIRLLQLGKPVGAPLGYSVVDDLRRIGVVVDDGSHTTTDVVQKLRLARIDAAVLLHGEVNARFAEDAALARELEILPRPFTEKPYYLLLSHRFVRSNPELAARIWAGIARERATPAWQERTRKALDGPR